ncbi:MAG TPA: aminoacyl-tRNA hydrolase [Dehalococcoidia bacterium]|nr:aminoacyl-tRNA hydrolase [Dehalococcoidia bacterium]
MSKDRWLIVGLGNPGPVYAHNRHNVGYWCLNRLARRHGLALKARTLAALAEGRIDSRGVLLAKPRTYVNQSGHAVSAVLRQAKIRPERMLVVCDDLDLAVGALRLRAQGGHGGHNGLRSIIAAVGTSDFPRLRIGIGRPVVDGEPVWDPDVVAVWVLSDPTPQEAELLQAAVAQAVAAAEAVLADGVEAAMNRYNR